MVNTSCGEKLILSSRQDLYYPVENKQPLIKKISIENEQPLIKEESIEEDLEQELASIIVEEKNKQFKIVIFTYYSPIDEYPEYVKYTRKTFEYYCNRHGYAFYFDDSKPKIKERYYIHHYRCYTGLKLQKMFPNAEWFVYVDSDVFVNRPELPIESHIDLTDKNILYHLFHERPWSFTVNSGVKFIRREAMIYEKKMWIAKEKWHTSPWDQNSLINYVLPMIPGKYIIHDPYVFNCLTGAHANHLETCIFWHMACTPNNHRDEYAKNAFYNHPIYKTLEI